MGEASFGASEPGTHFERMAEVYRRARPPYPDALYERLVEFGVLTPGCRLLEIGAGTGQATSRLVQAGARVTAVEPGVRLAEYLTRSVHVTEVIVDTFENAAATGRLSDDGFDSVCVATAFHWLDPVAALPAIARILVPGGLLAVWRHVFGDPSVTTPFRHRLTEIVARREDSAQARQRHRAQFDWTDALTVNGLFDSVHHEHFRWSVDLSPGQVHDLFRTFSDWEPHEVDEVAAVVDELGGTVTEHYGTTLAIVRSTR
jgi:SAM-dependent methyltransferase